MSESSRDRTTTLLGEVESGSPGSSLASDLLPLVYDELRAVAGRLMNNERADHTLQPTALVHEAFLKLVDQTRVGWRGRTHFKAVAAEAMKRILIDHARTRGAQKRGGGMKRISLASAAPPSSPSSPSPLVTPPAEFDLLDVGAALDTLDRLDARAAQVVALRFFGGLTVDEVSTAIEVSRATIERDWTFASAWLHRELGAKDHADA